MGANLRPELERLLRAAGCYFIRAGRGDHSIWFSPLSGTPFTVDGKILYCPKRFNFIGYGASS